MTGTEQSKIRERLMPAIDEFTEDLRSFAEGSYLRDNERTHWEQPFPTEVADEVRNTLIGFVSRLDNEVVNVDEEAKIGLVDDAVRATVEKLRSINEANEEAVLDIEEYDELSRLFAVAIETAGVDSDEVPTDFFSTETFEGE